MIEKQDFRIAPADWVAVCNWLRDNDIRWTNKTTPTCAAVRIEDEDDAFFFRLRWL
jgi:hypothetical protein